MTNWKTRLAPLALLLVAAAIAAPTASATTDAPPFTYAAGATDAGQVRVVEVPSNAGFDWGDAGIGAGAAVAVVLVGLGATLAIVSGRHRHAVPHRRTTRSAP
jgi:hypothetical protein